MLNDHLARQARRGAALALSVAVLAAASACGSDNAVTGTGIDPTRTYNQVQRLGNPLVSEVLLLKRDHAFHGSTAPEIDVATFTPNVKGFIAQFRPNATGLQTAIAATLLPDMLTVFTAEPTNPGYLSYVLNPKGYGGRKLGDDVVDISLTAIFSDLLDPTESVCKPFTLPLCTDNVASHGGFTTTFPYVAAPK